MRVYIQVHNRGRKAATNVAVKAFFTDASLGLPDLPTAFWTGFPNNALPTTSPWKVVAPHLILPSLVSGGTLTFLMTVTELSSTILLYSAAWTTMSVVIFQAALGLGGHFGLAASTSVVMMASVYLPLNLVRRRFALAPRLEA